MSPNPNRGQQSGPPLNSCAIAAMAAELGRRAKIQARHGDLIGQDLINAAAPERPLLRRQPGTLRPNPMARNSRAIAF